MALPDQIELLCLAIQKKASDEAEKILSEARQRHDDMIRGALEDIERQIEQKKDELRKKAYQDARRKIDAAELKGRRKVMALREDVFSETLSIVRQRLDALRGHSAEYKSVLEAMIRKALGILGSRGIAVRCAGPDRGTVQEVIAGMSEESGAEIELDSSPAEISGGLIASTPDGRQLVDLSFDALLKEMEPEMRKILASAVFEGVDSG